VSHWEQVLARGAFLLLASWSVIAGRRKRGGYVILQVMAALHRSEDGMRPVNYAQWTSAQTFAGRHGLGTSDPHLYQLDTIILAVPGHTTN
jgi:hypothetical protein